MRIISLRYIDIIYQQNQRVNETVTHRLKKYFIKKCQKKFGELKFMTIFTFQYPI